ncbi:MAG: YcjX family protein [Mariprofundales bacterium]
MVNNLINIKNKIGSAIEATKEVIPDILIPIKTKKIAITGLSRSGKTIFITSLIDQLLHPKKIPMLTTNKRPFHVTLKAPKASIKRFDYYKFNKDIKQHRQWPEGTDSITSTLLEVECRSRFAILGNSRFNIELIDYPGEWILDIALLNLSFAEWSEKVLRWLSDCEEDLAVNYLDEIKKLSATSSGSQLENDLHNQYVDMICYLKKNHYANLTPGRFLMPADLEGDPILLFAPIPKTNSPLYTIFKQRYDSYLKDIVKEIQLKHFMNFDKQIILIDVVEALQNEYKCYHDMTQGLRSMLSLYDNKNQFFLAKLFGSSIDKVVFVATKADLIASSQHDNYLKLLKEMVADIQQRMDIKHIKTEAHVIAAVKCTQTICKKYQGELLYFVRGIDAKDNKSVEVYPGTMQSFFPHPENWNQNEYDFATFMPSKKLYKDNEPFDNIHMDRVINAIIGDML